MANDEVYYSCGCYSRDGVIKERVCDDDQAIVDQATRELEGD